MDQTFLWALEAATEAKRGWELARTRNSLSRVDRSLLVVRAALRCLDVLKSLVSLSKWTEDGFLLALGEEHRNALVGVRSAAKPLLEDYLGGLSSEFDVMCSMWERDFGNLQEADALESDTASRRQKRCELAAALYAAAEALADLVKQVGQVARAPQGSNLVPSIPDRLAIVGTLEDRFVDQLEIASEAVERFDQRDVSPLDSKVLGHFVWLRATLEYQYLRDHGHVEERASSTRDLVLTGLQRIRDEVASGTASSVLARAWHRFGERLYEDLGSAEFWSVVGTGFFRPEDWATRARLLSPISDNALVLKRLGLQREVKELYEGFIIGNWISVISLSRIVLERTIKQQLGVSPDDKSQTLDRLLNAWATKFGANDELRAAAHRVKDSGNRRLHRSGLQSSDFEETAMQAQAEMCLTTLHQVFAFSDR